jgi:hypothetical protein
MEKSFRTVQDSSISLPYAALRKVGIERRSQERRNKEQRQTERRLQDNRRQGKRGATIEELRRYLQSQGVDDSQVAVHVITARPEEASRERRNGGRRRKERRAAERRASERRVAERRHMERRSTLSNHLKRTFKMVRRR